MKRNRCSNKNFIFLKWKRAQGQIGKTKAYADDDDVEISLDDICWSTKIIDLKRKISYEFGVPVEHQVMRIQEALPHHAVDSIIHDATTLKQLRYILGSSSATEQKYQYVPKSIRHFIMKLRRKQYTHFNYVNKINQYYMELVAPVYPGLLFTCTEPTKYHQQISSPPPSLFDMYMAYSSESQDHQRFFNDLSLIEENIMAKRNARNRSAIKDSRTLLHPISPSKIVDTIILETKYPSFEYQPGGKHCTMKRYLNSFFTASCFYALLFSALIGLFGSILWHVGTYEAPKPSNVSASLSFSSYILPEEEVQFLIQDKNSSCTMSPTSIAATENLNTSESI